MNFDPNIKARLVYDGGDKVFIPPEMGKPRSDQMQGTVHEQLSELCGRVCYDSLGSGRNSADYHKHLIEVNHGSVYEHAHFTIKLRFASHLTFRLALIALANRPGLNIVFVSDEEIRVTVNYRHLLDWDKWTRRNPFVVCEGDAGTMAAVAHDCLLFEAKKAAPSVVKHIEMKEAMHQPDRSWVIPLCETEKWITLFLSGSRGFSHEQVRHRFNISQRSTRYVDESESPWVQHPLVSKWLGDYDVALNQMQDTWDFDRMSKTLASDAQQLYRFVTEKLQAYLISKGVDKFSARKQARGAARGYLGNALLTEMMFSASVADWKGMLRQRLTGAADAEIRVLYSAVLPELKRSRYGDSFAEFETMDAKDGIGTVLKGT